MKQLRISPMDLLVHSAMYSGAIARMLEELLSGRGFWTPKAKTAITIPPSEKDVCVRYVRIIYDLHLAWDLLSLPPEALAKVAAWVGAIRESLAKTSEDSEEAMSACDKMLKKVFAYEKFGAGYRPRIVEGDNRVVCRWEDCSDVWSAWHFIKHLNVRACVYCNAETVFSLQLNGSIPGEKRKFAEVVVNEEDDEEEDANPLRKRSALDHFWGHSEYPYLAMSLYNLVPACTRCNTNIKGARRTVYGEYVHPYEVSLDEGVEFSAIYDKIKFHELSDSDIHLKVLPRQRIPRCVADQARKSAEFFHLEEVYNQLHKADAADVIRNATFVPREYRRWLDATYPMISTVCRDRMQWGVSLDPKEINEHILAKMTIDLHRQFIPHNSPLRGFP